MVSASIGRRHILHTTFFFFFVSFSGERRGPSGWVVGLGPSGWVRRAGSSGKAGEADEAGCEGCEVKAGRAGRGLAAVSRRRSVGPWAAPPRRQGRNWVAPGRRRLGAAERRRASSGGGMLGGRGHDMTGGVQRGQREGRRRAGRETWAGDGTMSYEAPRTRTSTVMEAGHGRVACVRGVSYKQACMYSTRGGGGGGSSASARTRACQRGRAFALTSPNT